MSNWWQTWAERIARILAERWLQSKSAGSNEVPGSVPPDDDSAPGESLEPSPEENKPVDG